MIIEWVLRIIYKETRHPQMVEHYHFHLLGLIIQAITQPTKPSYNKENQVTC
jgi:hypothetical protein